MLVLMAPMKFSFLALISVKTLPCPEAWEENKCYDVLMNNSAGNPNRGFSDKVGRERLYNKDDMFGSI